MRSISCPAPHLSRIPRPVRRAVRRVSRHVTPMPRIVCHAVRTVRGAANTKSFSCQESHQRKTWPSTAPPNAGPRTHDPISPTTLPTPMPVSTPTAVACPRRNSSQRTAYCMGLRARIAPAHKQRARTTSNTIATHIDSRRALGFRVSRSTSWCKTIWSAPGRLLRSRLSSTCKNLSSSAHESSKSGVS